MTHMVAIDLWLRYPSTPTKVEAVVAKLPEGVDVLLGAQWLYENRVDFVAQRMVVPTCSVEIDLESRSDVAARLAEPAFKVVDACGGGAFAYCPFRDLGYRASEWIHIEIGKPQVKVSRQIIPPSILRVYGDVAKVKEEVVEGSHLYLCGSPCQSFSGANNSARGASPSADGSLLAIMEAIAVPWKLGGASFSTKRLVVIDA